MPYNLIIRQENKLLTAAVFLLLLSLFSECNSSPEGVKNSISVDSLTIANGGVLFSKNCSSCHDFKQDGIGPQLGGITARVSVDGLKKIIKNSQQVIAAGDERAMGLFSKNHRAVMPSLS